MCASTPSLSNGVPMWMVPEVPGASKVLTCKVVGTEDSDLAGDHFFLVSALRS